MTEKGPNGANALLAAAETSNIHVGVASPKSWAVVRSDPMMLHTDHKSQYYHQKLSHHQDDDSTCYILPEHKLQRIFHIMPLIPKVFQVDDIA